MVLIMGIGCVYIALILIMIVITRVQYVSGKSALPDIYMHDARGRVRIYQAKHECLCYNLYIATTWGTTKYLQSKLLRFNHSVSCGFWFVCVMILVRIIMQTLYIKPTTKPHNLHYKYNHSGSAVGSADQRRCHSNIISNTHNQTSQTIL